PIPPTGYSALTYFADSLGTYVYDWDSLAWLRVPGTGGGGGGGGLATADNGLSVNPAGNVRLGGSSLLQNTIVGGGSSIGTPRNLTLGASNDWLNQFSVNAGGTTTEQGRLSVSNSGITLQMFRNPALGKLTSFSIPTLNPVSFTIDSLSTSATHNFLIYSDKIVGSIENVRYFTLSPDRTRFDCSPTSFDINGAPETAVLSSTAGSQIHFNVATPASPVITTQAAENFTISKPLGLMSSSGSLQIGGPDGLVTSLENTES